LDVGNKDMFRGTQFHTASSTPTIPLPKGDVKGMCALQPACGY